MPGVGLEPTCPYGREILSLLRMTIPPPGRAVFLAHLGNFFKTFTGVSDIVGPYSSPDFMTRICTACGVSPAMPEPEPPASATGVLPEVNDPDKCSNCGKEGTMQDVVEPVVSPEDEE